MKRKYFLFLILFVITTKINVSNALILEDLYTVELPVANRTISERENLFLQGFDRVLLRLTGDSKNFAKLEQKLIGGQINKFISTFSYVDNIDNNVILKITYNESVINSFLQSNDLIIMGKDRPIVLTWLLIEDNYKFDFINENEHESFILKLEQLASEQAIPIVLPLFDLEEQNKIHINDVLDSTKVLIDNAFTKYNADCVLVGKIVKQSEYFVGVWNLNKSGFSEAWEIKSSSLEDFYVQLMYELRKHLINDIPSQLSSEDNLNTTNPEDNVSHDVNNIAIVKITGVDSIENYASLLDYFRKLSLVKKVKVLGIANNTATFEIDLNASVDIINKILIKDGLLASDNEIQDNLQQNELNYRINK